MTTRLGFYVARARRALRSWSEAFELSQRFPSARIDPDVRVVSPHLLELGARVQLQHGCVLHCGGLSWSDGRGRISIGDDSVVSPGCVLYGAGEIQIGPRFDCGPQVMIFSSRSGYEREQRGQHLLAPVKIGADVIVYAGCVIGPGVSIGDGAVIGAGSVVLEDVAAHSLALGTPAKAVREL